MKTAMALILSATPVMAWDFSPTPLCTVTHEDGGVSVRMTYDPRQAQAYAITLTRDSDWPDGGVFSIAFEGPAELTISTNRHIVDGPSVTVTDTGCGNVLDGLEFNRRATAYLGATSLSVSLDGAQDKVQAFRACTAEPIA